MWGEWVSGLLERGDRGDYASGVMPRNPGLPETRGEGGELGWGGVSEDGGTDDAPRLTTGALFVSDNMTFSAVADIADSWRNWPVGY